MHDDATSRLESPVLQLTKDGRMFQSEWGCELDWFSGPHCGSRQTCVTVVSSLVFCHDIATLLTNKRSEFSDRPSSLCVDQVLQVVSK